MSSSIVNSSLQCTVVSDVFPRTQILQKLARNSILFLSSHPHSTALSGSRIPTSIGPFVSSGRGRAVCEIRGSAAAQGIEPGRVASPGELVTFKKEGRGCRGVHGRRLTGAPMASLSELLNPTGGMEEHDYAQLPSMIEEEYEEEYDDQPGAMGPDGHGFLKGEVGSSLRIRNLDAWFQALYQYYKEKGFYCIVTSRVVNLLTLGFTIFLSGFILLYLDFAYLSGQCALRMATSVILRDATFRNPLRHRSFLYNLVVVCYLMLFSLYFLWSLVRLAHDFKPLLEMRAFCNRKLQLSDRDIQTITWPEVVARVVHLQATTRLCIVKDLNEHDIVARILRKENYLLGMLNREVIGLKLNIPFSAIAYG